MGLFDQWKNKTDADKLQQKYLTDFEKGKVNKANELAEGIMQSVLELGTMTGLTKQETLDKFNAQLANPPTLSKCRGQRIRLPMIQPIGTIAGVSNDCCFMWAAGGLVDCPFT